MKFLVSINTNSMWDVYRFYEILSFDEVLNLLNEYNSDDDYEVVEVETSHILEHSDLEIQNNIKLYEKAIEYQYKNKNIEILIIPILL